MVAVNKTPPENLREATQTERARKTSRGLPCELEAHGGGRVDVKGWRSGPGMEVGGNIHLASQ